MSEKGFYISFPFARAIVVSLLASVLGGIVGAITWVNNDAAWKSRIETELRHVNEQNSKTETYGETLANHEARIKALEKR